MLSTKVRADLVANGQPPANINVIYDVGRNQYLYIDPALTHFLKLKKADQPDINELRSRIDEPEWIILRSSFDALLRGEFVGTLQIHFRAEEEKQLNICPLLVFDEDRKLLLASVSDNTFDMLNLKNIRKFANKKNSVLTMLAHDLRGPLSVSEEVLKLLSSSVRQKQYDDPRLSSSLRGVAVILRQSLDLINDLIHREFLETIETVLVKKPIDISQRLEEYMEQCRKNDQNSKRRFVFSRSHEQIILNMDEAKFMQIINNLMSNALKFTREGDTISLDVKKEHDHVLFTFSDSGIGIPADSLPHVFEKFTDARREGLRGEPTIGLGLYIVKMIADWHEGTISVSSAENAGTTFHLRLPVS